MKLKNFFVLGLVCLLVFPAVAPATPGPQPETVSPTYWSPYSPPKPLRFAEDHWTPYFPPEKSSFPPDAEVHVVAVGETLWALANQFHGDNLLWPFLWEHNSYITDPHWIYPGDPLYVPPLLVITPGELERVEDFRAPDLGETFMPAGTLASMECSFYIAPYLDEKETRTEWGDWDTMIIGSDEPMQMNHTTQEIMYINKGQAEGVIAGQEFTVLKWERSLDHPIHRDAMGEVIQMIGTVRVLCTQDHTSTVVITSSCDGIEPGHRLRPWEPRVPPLRPVDIRAETQCVAENPYGRGRVVYIKEGHLQAAEWNQVAIDLGSVDGVIPGDRFIVYRDTQQELFLRPEHKTFGKIGLKRYNKKPYRKTYWQAETLVGNAYPNPYRGPFRTRKLLTEMREETGIPRRVLGEMVVLATSDTTSVAILSASSQEIWVGDKIELKGGQPVR